MADTDARTEPYERVIERLTAENAKLRTERDEVIRAMNTFHGLAGSGLVSEHKALVEVEKLRIRNANLVAHVRTFIDGDCSLDAMEAALEDAYGEAADVACRMNVLKSRNACLTALLELALPHVEKAANCLATGPVAGPVEHLADDIRQALAKEMDANPLDEAWGRINALGGTCADDFDRGADWAISAALSIIEDLGGKDPILKETDQ